MGPPASAGFGGPLGPAARTEPHVQLSCPAKILVTARPETQDDHVRCLVALLGHVKRYVTCILLSVSGQCSSLPVSLPVGLRKRVST